MREFVFKADVGMTVYLQPTGNAARYWDGKLKEGKIISVKRVYFYVEVGADPRNVVRFERCSCQNYDSDLNTGYIAYASEQAYLTSSEMDTQLRQIRKVFANVRGCSANLSAYNVRQIWEILLNAGAIENK